MKISLREITIENFEECLNVSVAENQKHFVSPPVKSLAALKVFPFFTPLAIYNEEEIVGFVMFGFNPLREKYWIVNLLIDERFQGRGYARAAMTKLIEGLKQLPDCKEIFISFVPGNVGAEKLYTNLGFEKTGDTEENGEIILRLPIVNNAKSKSEIKN